MSDPTRTVSRRLRDLCEPIAGSVYFVPEAQEAYKTLGLDNYGHSYFCSRGACLGHPSGPVVTAAFGVFNPDIVIPSVDSGWAATDRESLLQARLDGATAALRRILGPEAESRAKPIVDILRPVMESRDYSGRALFAGLRSLPFPGDPIGALFRVCDYVRERRGDNHIVAWVGAACDPVEISLLTELLWGLQLGQYSPTRGWTKDQIADGISRLEGRGYVRDGAFTDEGRTYRRGIESHTDALDADVVDALGGDADEVFRLLEPLQQAVLEAKAYPVNPAATMNQDDG